MQPHEQAQFLRATSQFIREQVELATKPLLQKIEDLEAQLAARPVIEEGDVVEATFSAVMKNIPKPDAFMMQVAELVEHERTATGEALLRISDVMKQMQDKIENLPIPKDGIDGKDADMKEINGAIEFRVNELTTLMREFIGNLFDTLPKPKDGRDGKDAPAIDVNDIITRVVAMVPQGEKGEPGPRGDTGEQGQQGPIGEKGKDAEIDWEGVRATIANVVEHHLEKHPIQNGKDGKDGTSVTLDDVAPLVSSAVGKAVSALPVPVHVVGGVIDHSGCLCLNLSDGKSVKLSKVVGEDGKSIDPEFVRKQIVELVAQIPKPLDGKDGAPGKDGVGFECIDFQRINDREYKFTVGNSDGTAAKEFTLKMDVPIYRDMYISGETYQRGDLVTLGGSLWHANKETSVRPETGLEDWTIAAKRGRDGKQGPPGVVGEKGKDGRDGRDLTQMTFEGKKY